MIPLRIVETERDDFEGPIAELWRDDDFIGQVFWDGETTIVQIYPASDGDVHDLPVADLLRVLDTAERIVDPLAFDQGDFVQLRQDLSSRTGDRDTGDEGTNQLMAEFDPLAAYRAEEGEGFFPRDVSERFISRCEELALAVVEMEGFDLEDGQLKPRPGLELMIRPESMMTWPEFRAYANARAADTLASWPRRESLVFAFVIQQPDGESIVA
jgi:hypothetical protein